MKKRFALCIILLALAFPPVTASAESPFKDMVYVKPGCFMMGTDKVFYYELGRENNRERPAHKVCLDGFYLDKYETTQKNWEKVMGFNISTFKGPDLPVTNIDWMQARTYCSKRGHRLPTEAEWEYAARAGSKTVNPWGDGINRDYLWFAGNSVRRPHPVGQKKPNAWGLYDMMGNVWEWVADWYSDNYYRTSPVNNPKGPATRQSWRVIRGGSWVDEEETIRVTVRYRGLADPTLDFWLGVRCAHTPEKKLKKKSKVTKR